jgi:hypothetical protein
MYQTKNYMSHCLNVHCTIELTLNDFLTENQASLASFAAEKYCKFILFVSSKILELIWGWCYSLRLLNLIYIVLYVLNQSPHTFQSACYFPNLVFVFPHFKMDLLKIMKRFFGLWTLLLQSLKHVLLPLTIIQKKEVNFYQ